MLFNVHCVLAQLSAVHHNADTIMTGERKECNNRCNFIVNDFGESFHLI